MKILLLDSNDQYREILKAFLTNYSCIVDSSSSVKQGSYLCKTNHYDIVLTAFELGDENALRFCCLVRAAGVKVPLVVYGLALPLAQRLKLYDAGIDELLIRPLHFEEVVARLRAILRRGIHLMEDTLIVGDVVLNRTGQRAFCNGKALSLSPKEFQVLELLMERHTRIVPRTTFYDRLWDMETDPRSCTIESHIYTLRRKLRDTGLQIETFQGRGYTLN